MSQLEENARALRKLLEIIVQDQPEEVALEMKCLHPKWSGDEIAYAKGLRLQYENELYTVLQPHVSQPDWTPEAAPSLFAKVLVNEDGTPKEWKQPDSTNPYAKGDKVLHGGHVWESNIDNNVWEPGVYGWTKVES